jgi:hypothetical protein
MRVVQVLRGEDADLLYRRECTGEKLGWVIFICDMTYARVHRVLSHPVDGPVIIINDEVFEVDPDLADVYPTENAAKEAYYAASATT